MTCNDNVLILVLKITISQWHTASKKIKMVIQSSVDPKERMNEKKFILVKDKNQIDFQGAPQQHVLSAHGCGRWEQRQTYQCVPTSPANLFNSADILSESLGFLKFTKYLQGCILQLSMVVRQQVEWSQCFRGCDWSHCVILGVLEIVNKTLA